MCDEDVAALVVDNGSGMCKVIFLREAVSLNVPCRAMRDPFNFLKNKEGVVNFFLCLNFYLC